MNTSRRGVWLPGQRTRTGPTGDWPRKAGYCIRPAVLFANAEPAGAGAQREKSLMECTVRWIEGMSFAAETGSGHLVTMDGAPDGGGRNLAPRPMEMVLVGTGGCTAYDVLLILKRGRHAVTGCEVKLEAERAPDDPKVFTRIRFHFAVRGRNLKRDIVERAVKLSHDKYCSATAMLARTAAIEYSIEVIEES